MESRRNPDIDDDFSEIYKAYTGPVGSNASNLQDKSKTSIRPYAGSDDEEQRDPNACPTDFTSREAKVWEAKSKATERNWKKRKEEEMICKICGIPGHFTQGCPSTLGASRKSQDFLERIPAREKHARALFTEKVIQKIEKEVGCHIKMDEKFIIVSGKDRLILKKGVDAVHKIKEEGEKKGSSSTHRSRSRSPERRSPLKSQYSRSDSQRSHSSPHNPSQFQHRFGGQDKTMESRIREDLQKPSRGSPQTRAFGVEGARGHSNHSKSPGRAAPYRGNSYSSYDGLNQRMGAFRADEWDAERQMLDKQSVPVPVPAPERSAFPQLAELEMEYNREVMELEKIRDKEDEEENYKHREAMKEMRETYIKKLSLLRGGHAKQWDDFLHFDAQRRLEQARQQMSSSGFGGYKQSGYPDYENHVVGNASSYGGGPGMPMDSRGGRYPDPMDNYHHPSRPHDTYSQFQRQRRDGYGGKAFDRY